MCGVIREKALRDEGGAELFKKDRVARRTLKDAKNYEQAGSSGWCSKKSVTSRFHEGSMFPKDSERFGKFRNHSVDFIILHGIWDQKYNITEEKLPKMALPDRHHM